MDENRQEDESTEKRQGKPKRNLPWNSPDHDPENFRLSLGEHLEELRQRIIRSFLIVCGFWIIAWFAFTPVYNLLTDRAVAAVRAHLPPGSKFSEQFLHASDPFMLVFKVSFYLALVFSFPLLVMQLWGFIAPGLKPEEQKPLKRIGPVSLFLFCMGAFFCWLILPAAFSWFADYLVYFKQTDLNQEAGTMAMFSLKSILAFGIGFQLPLVVFILGSLNLLSSRTLMKYWRQGAVAIFFISGAITPSNDIPTMLMMAIPLTILFMISAYAVRYVQKGKKQSEFLFGGFEDDDEESSKKGKKALKQPDNDFKDQATKPTESDHEDA